MGQTLAIAQPVEKHDGIQCPRKRGRWVFVSIPWKYPLNMTKNVTWSPTGPVSSSPPERVCSRKCLSPNDNSAASSPREKSAPSRREEEKNPSPGLQGMLAKGKMQV